MTKDQSMLLLLTLGAMHVLLCVRLAWRTYRAGLGWAKWFVISLLFSTAAGTILASRAQGRRAARPAEDEPPAVPADEETDAIRQAALAAAEPGEDQPAELHPSPAAPPEENPPGEGEPQAPLLDGEGYLFVCPHCRRLVGRVKGRPGKGELERCPYCQQNLDEAQTA